MAKSMYQKPRIRWLDGRWQCFGGGNDGNLASFRGAYGDTPLAAYTNWVFARSGNSYLTGGVIFDNPDHRLIAYNSHYH